MKYTQKVKCINRQIGIFNSLQYDQHSISIIGCGAVGTAVGIILCKLGMKFFELWDNDTVALHNLPNQFFKNDDIGNYKTSSLKNVMELFGIDVEINIENEFFTKSNKFINPIIFSCVDSMSARKLLFEKAVRSKIPKLFIDTRMGGEIFEIFTIDLTNKEAIKYYRTTLYPDSEAMDTPCTNKAIIYNVMVIGALAICQLTKVLNNTKYKLEITGDLVNVMIK